jgi:hypothetical protein
MRICQPLRTASGEEYFLSATASGGLPLPSGKLVLEDPSLLPHTGPWNIQISRGGCYTAVERRVFQSCHYAWIDPTLIRVVFDGGEVTLSLRIAQVDATMFALLSKAKGVLDDTAFEQTNYWKLAFYSWLHFFQCDYIILFDNPMVGKSSA